MKNLVRRVPGAERVARTLKSAYAEWNGDEPFPRGHFYSPLPDVSWVRANRAKLFRRGVKDIAGVDLRRTGQGQLLDQLAKYYGDFSWPEVASPERRYHLGQDAFCIGDALMLHGMLREFRPVRIIEVGSGHSSALMLDVAERYLGGDTQLTFIEPYPAVLKSRLRPADEERIHIIPTPVQDVALDTFRELNAGDLLFIDSTHVSRIGSDVNYLVFDVLPALAAGVIVHFHDVFWPFEYPEKWLEQGWAWNEDYLLRAFLQYNSSFEILLFNSMLGQEKREWLAEHMPRFLDNTGGSLWLRKTGAPSAGVR